MSIIMSVKVLRNRYHSAPQQFCRYHSADDPAWAAGGFAPPQESCNVGRWCGRKFAEVHGNGRDAHARETIVTVRFGRAEPRYFPRPMSQPFGFVLVL